MSEQNPKNQHRTKMVGELDGGLGRSVGHTPGPWRLQDQRKSWDGKSSDWHYGLRIAAPDNCHIAQVGHVDARYKDDAEANARLIAAAPELLSELKKTLNWLRHIRPQVKAPESVMTGFDQAIGAHAAAIAKATE